jgi:hypothetical protein
MSDVLKRVVEHLWQWNQFTLADELTIHMGKLADENDRLRAERDEAVKLLDSDDVGDQCSWFMERPQGECGWGGQGPCWSHRKKALLAKLRTP